MGLTPPCGYSFLSLENQQPAATDGRGRRTANFAPHSCDSTNLYRDLAKFTQEIEKHMVAAFSALELHLKTKGRVFGELVFHLLGINQIRRVRMLKIFIAEVKAKDF